jgi:hypothetical protein
VKKIEVVHHGVHPRVIEKWKKEHRSNEKTWEQYQAIINKWQFETRSEENLRLPDKYYDTIGRFPCDSCKNYNPEATERDSWDDMKKCDANFAWWTEEGQGKCGGFAKKREV